MSLDTAIIARKCQVWLSAPYLALPQQVWEPVIWVGDDERLNLWHPAIDQDISDAKGPPASWDRAQFDCIAAQLMLASRDVIVQRIADYGYPEGYFSEYPSIVARVQAGDSGMTMHFGRR